ncbi:SemiSWEET family sugar transporter [Chloroflexota bacterium]
MSLADYIGLIAGGIVTLGLIPQIIRIYKLKSAHDISAIFNLAMLTGMTLFLIYGILLGLRPLILWNVIGMILISILLYGKWKYGR